MTTRLQNAFAEIFGQKQNDLRGTPGVLGDGFGNVSVSGRTGFVYVRVAGRTIQALNLTVETADDTPVYVGFEPSQPTLLQILGKRFLANIEYDGRPERTVDIHAETHNWLGSDVVYTHLRQFLPWRITPVATGTAINVFGTAAWSSGSYQQAYLEEFDLFPAIPHTTGAHRWVLISYDDQGAFRITTGTETTSDLTYFDIPEPPPDYRYAIGAVRLHFDTTEIADAVSFSDIADLRFPMRHRHPEYLTTGSLGVGHIIQDEGVDLANRARLNFIGQSVFAQDNAVTSVTDVFITGSPGHIIDDMTQRGTLAFSGTSIGLDLIDDAGLNETRVYISGTQSLTMQDEGVNLPDEPNLNFVGDGITAADDPANNRTNVFVTGTFFTLTQLHEHTYNENMSLMTDGVQVAFSTNNEFEPESSLVYLNGNRQILDEDYTETSLYNEITFTVAPLEPDKLVVDYIPA